MNILPKKRWHVRTKENIARVRKDEAEAAEKEKEERTRIEKAEREARLNILKQKSKQKLQEFTLPNPEKEKHTEHVNLFSDYENAIKVTNKEHDKEVKEKKEEYEKKIGYLTYLGQDTNEALGKKNWYEVAPETSRYSKSTLIKDTYDKLVLKDEDGKPKMLDMDIRDGEICWKKKQIHDPINVFKKYLHVDKVNFKNKPTINMDNTSCTRSVKAKHKKKNHKKYEDKDIKLKKLRELRLKREQQEKYKTELFLSKLDKPMTNTEAIVDTGVKPKYNSQFNPELARQNYR